jgi:hypothetical protein
MTTLLPRWAAAATLASVLVVPQNCGTGAVSLVVLMNSCQPVVVLPYFFTIGSTRFMNVT